MANNNKWVIFDNNGVIHSGTEETMTIAFQVMQGNWVGLSGLKSERKRLSDLYETNWDGDLCLAEIHNVTR